MCSTPQKKSLIELRKDFYKLRSFEISNLWQRSIFLSAIIVLLFTGYGCLVLEIVREGAKVLLISEISCVISIIGFGFSIIWIMMAKGSKAWYEVYERKINLIEKELDIDKKYLMKTAECKSGSLDSNLRSKLAGTYSVSKLNILIGQILAKIWFLAIVIHSFVILFNIDEQDCIVNVFHVLFVVFIIVLVIYIFFKAQEKNWAHSTSLKEAEEDEARE